MPPTRFIARFPTTRPPIVVAGIGLSVMALLAVAAHRAEPRRHNPFPTLTAQAAVVVAPTGSADMTAVPAVTTPAASVARFSVVPLQTVAGIIHAVRSKVLAASRMGGLHGP